MLTLILLLASSEKPKIIILEASASQLSTSHFLQHQKLYLFVFLLNSVAKLFLVTMVVLSCNLHSFI